jgi:hypothetical protein
MILDSSQGYAEQRTRGELAHRRRLRDRVNRTWDMLQAQQLGHFERRLARPTLSRNGQERREDATP